MELTLYLSNSVHPHKPPPSSKSQMQMGTSLQKKTESSSPSKVVAVYLYMNPFNLFMSLEASLCRKGKKKNLMYSVILFVFLLCIFIDVIFVLLLSFFLVVFIFIYCCIFSLLFSGCCMVDYDVTVPVHLLL
ncbi:hypothetical protein CsatB_026292 [Cannabis sativa]